MACTLVTHVWKMWYNLFWFGFWRSEWILLMLNWHCLDQDIACKHESWTYRLWILGRGTRLSFLLLLSHCCCTAWSCCLARSSWHIAPGCSVPYRWSAWTSPGSSPLLLLLRSVHQLAEDMWRWWRGREMTENRRVVAATCCCVCFCQCLWLCCISKKQILQCSNHTSLSSSARCQVKVSVAGKRTEGRKEKYEQTLPPPFIFLKQYDSE